MNTPDDEEGPLHDTIRAEQAENKNSWATASSEQIIADIRHWAEAIRNFRPDQNERVHRIAYAMTAAGFDVTVQGDALVMPQDLIDRMIRESPYIATPSHIYGIPVRAKQ